MSADQTKTEAKVNQSSSDEQGSTLGMESVNRIAKLPVIESTISAATNIYEKVKDSNSYINWTLSTAENTVNTAVEKITPLATPVAARLEGPMKKVDSMLCTGLDYVENIVPCVKLPPGEMYENTKNYINETVTPAVQTACDVMQPAVQTARDVMQPAVETALGVMQPAMQQAMQVKDTCVSKVEEYLGKSGDAIDGDAQEDCKTCDKHK